MRFNSSWRARAFLTAAGAWTLFVGGHLVRGVEECVEGRANGATAGQTAELNLLQHGGLGSVERLPHRGEIVVARKVALGREHLRKGGAENSRRVGVHGRHPADAKVDGGRQEAYEKAVIRTLGFKVDGTCM